MVNVDRNSIKFTIGIKGWPFLSTDNILKFGAALDVPGKPGAPERNTTRSGARFRFGCGDLSVTDQAVVDGQNRNISTSVFQRGSRLLVDWEFPAFQSSLEYDPSFNINDITGGDDEDNDDDRTRCDKDTKVVVIAVVGTIAAAMLGAGVTLYCMRLRARRRMSDDFEQINNAQAEVYYVPAAEQ